MDQLVRQETTRILGQVVEGDADAVRRLLPIVYDQLRELAAGYLRRERPGHTLAPTALVHEAYLRLVESTRVDWRGKSHFMATAARAMRHILVDHARGRLAAKRGGKAQRVFLNTSLPGHEVIDLGDVVECLEVLATLNKRHAEIATLRLFGGLTLADIAHTLRVSMSTVTRDWKMALAWLRCQLEEKGSGP